MNDHICMYVHKCMRMHICVYSLLHYIKPHSLHNISYAYAAICHSGCFHGECVAPDNCTCESGWIGFTCNTGGSDSVFSLSHFVEKSLKTSLSKTKEFILFSCVLHINKYSKITCIYYLGVHVQLGTNMVSVETNMCTHLLLVKYCWLSSNSLVHSCTYAQV